MPKRIGRRISYGRARRARGMAYKKKKRAAYKAKKRQRIAKVNHVGSAKTPFPQTLYTTLSYGYSTQLTISTTNYAAPQVVRMNSLFDPEERVGGEQPAYRDVFAGVYSSYQVMAARITVKFEGLNTGTDPTEKVKGMCYVRAISSVEGTIGSTNKASMLLAQPRIKYKDLSSDSNSHVFKYVSMYAVPHQIERLSKGDDGLTAVFGTNPAVVPAFEVGFCRDTAAYGTTGMVIAVTINIKYYTKFTGRKYRDDD